MNAKPTDAIGNSLHYEFLMPLLQLPPIVYVTLVWALNWGGATTERQKRFLKYLTEHYELGVFGKDDAGDCYCGTEVEEDYRLELTIVQHDYMNRLFTTSSISVIARNPLRPISLISRFEWYYQKIVRACREIEQFEKSIGGPGPFPPKDTEISSTEFFDAFYDLYRPLLRK